MDYHQIIKAAKDLCYTAKKSAYQVTAGINLHLGEWIIELAYSLCYSDSDSTAFHQNANRSVNLITAVYINKDAKVITWLNDEVVKYCEEHNAEMKKLHKQYLIAITKR